MNTKFALKSKKTLLLFIFCMFVPCVSQAAGTNYTLVLTADHIISEPFGLTSLPATIYGYFRIDDSLLDTDGTYHNQLTGFVVSINGSTWNLADLGDTFVEVQSRNIVNFFVDSSVNSLNDNQYISFSDFDVDTNSFNWQAIDAYERETPLLSGTYQILEGKVKNPVPVPSAIVLLSSGLLFFAGFHRKKI